MFHPGKSSECRITHCKCEGGVGHEDYVDTRRRVMAEIGERKFTTICSRPVSRMDDMVPLRYGPSVAHEEQSGEATIDRPTVGPIRKAKRVRSPAPPRASSMIILPDDEEETKPPVILSIKRRRYSADCNHGSRGNSTRRRAGSLSWHLNHRLPRSLHGDAEPSDMRGDHGDDGQPSDFLVRDRSGDCDDTPPSQSMNDE